MAHNPALMYALHMFRGGVLLLALVAGGQGLAQTTDLNRVAVGSVAPDFELPSAAGNNLRLSSMRGKVVVLVFYRGYW